MKSVPKFMMDDIGILGIINTSLTKRETPCARIICGLIYSAPSTRIVLNTSRVLEGLNGQPKGFVEITH